jgi:hypothetical protein
MKVFWKLTLQLMEISWLNLDDGNATSAHFQSLSCLMWCPNRKHPADGPETSAHFLLLTWVDSYSDRLPSDVDSCYPMVPRIPETIFNLTFSQVSFCVVLNKYLKPYHPSKLLQSFQNCRDWVLFGPFTALIIYKASRWQPTLNPSFHYVNANHVIERFLDWKSCLWPP